MRKNRKNKNGLFKRLSKLTFVIAIVICLCNLAALCLAFFAGFKFAEKKKQDDELVKEVAPDLPGQTTGLPVTDPALAKAEMEWDTDSGAV